MRGSMGVGVVLVGLLATACGTDQNSTPVETTTTVAETTTTTVPSTTVPSTTLPPTTLPPTTLPPTVVLGDNLWAPYVNGFGVERPSQFNGGGNSTSGVHDVTWKTWGGPVAEGDGTSSNAEDVEGIYQAVSEPAHVVAWDIGTCGGRRAYRKVQWYFRGRAWSPNDDSLGGGICGNNGGLSANSLTTAGIAPLRFGESVARAEGLSGKRSSPCGDDPRNRLVEDALPGMNLFFRDDRLWFITVTGAGVSTPSGGRVGAPIEQIARIPEAVRTSVYGDREYYVVRSATISLVMWIDAGHVTTIAVGPRDFAEDIGDLCL